MLSSFDLITALTIVGILGILVLYIAVVYKKGWLKRNTGRTHFLCPNPKCRKPFPEPFWLTDLSGTPPKSYPACPNCGINLNTIPFFSAPKSPILKSTHGPPPSFKEIKKPKPIERTQTIQREISEGLRKATALPESKSLVKTPEIKNETSSTAMGKPQMKEEKKSSPSSRDCPHFFGYVRSLPKNTPIPNACLGCPWIVECLTQTAEKVEA